MGLFDIFKSKSKSVAPPPPQVGDKNVARLARVAGDRHAQNYDRMEAIESLARLQSSEAASGLLRRFTFYIEPSITDQEEKEVAFRGVIDCGEDAVDAIVTFCEKAESLSWPLKILRDILPRERFIEEVIEMLEGFDTNYTRNVDPKTQLISSLEGEAGEAAREVVLGFLEDVSEPVRFQAVSTLLSTNHEELAPRLVEFSVDEESVRVRNKVAEGLASRGWVVPQALRDRFASAIFAGGFSVDAQGRVTARLAAASRRTKPRTARKPRRAPEPPGVRAERTALG